VVHCIDDAVQRIAHNSINAAHSGADQGFDQVFCDSCHGFSRFFPLFLISPLAACGAGIWPPPSHITLKG
jgi:hypothetical protein